MTAHPAPEAAWLVALAQLPGVGPATLLACHRGPGAEAAWRALVAGRPRREAALAALVGRTDETALARVVSAARELDPEVELERQLAAGRRVLVEGRPGYPTRLANDPAPPAVLFAAGSDDALERPTVAVIGTRNATRPGRDLARRLGDELARSGVSVVSGLALGIDGAAHQGVLGSGAGAPGRAIGVIASGLDVAYPRRHQELHRQVEATGLLLSETPLGFRPASWRFPARNRIIAGLADAVVVVESRSGGGSLLTVAEALHRGVSVLAVPGHPTAPASAGTNDLIFDGAGLVRTVQDVWDAIGFVPPADAPPSGAGPVSPELLEPAERAVMAAIGETPAALSEVVARTRLTLEEAAEALARLETRRLVVRTGAWFERAQRWPSGRSGEPS